MKKTISKSGSIYIQKSVRNGTRVSSKTVKKLGRIDELMKEKNMTREQVPAWADSEIEKLELEEKKRHGTEVTITIPVREAPHGSLPLKQAGYLFLQKICYELRVDEICKKIAEAEQIYFDFPQIVLSMIYIRILGPSSDCRVWLDSENLAEVRVINKDIERSLDLLARNMPDALLQLCKSSSRSVQRNTDAIYYICTDCGSIRTTVEDVFPPRSFVMTDSAAEMPEWLQSTKTWINDFPENLRKGERIKAHLLIGYMAFMVFRILEKRLRFKYSEDEILSALRSFQFYDLSGQGYCYAYEPSEVTRALTDLISSDFNKTFLTNAQMKKIIKESRSRKIS